VRAEIKIGHSVMSTTAGTWTDAGVTAPPKDESSYLRLARVDDLGRRQRSDGQKSARRRFSEGAVKAMGKPSKREETKINKITKHLSENEKI
jgi:hypothetical protein